MKVTKEGRKTSREAVQSVKDSDEKKYLKKTKATATLNEMFYWSAKWVPKVDQIYKNVQGLAEQLTKKAKNEKSQKTLYLEVLNKIEDKIVIWP